jgi:hypothetical protein
MVSGTSTGNNVRLMMTPCYYLPMLILRSCVVGMVAVQLVSGVAGCSGGDSSSPTAPTPVATATGDGSPTVPTPTPITHELGVCGVTSFESSQRPTLRPIVISEGDPMYGVGFHYCMKVFGASMWAVEKFPEPQLRHVASIAAEYLDNNEDGIVDDPAVNAALVANYAVMYLVDEFDKFLYFDMSDSSAINRMKTTVAQHSGETHPQALLTTDVTLEEVNHLLLFAGYGSAYPALRSQTADGPLPNNLLTNAMKISQQNGDYLRFDPPASSEFFYWGVTTLMGAQRLPGSHCEKSGEWKLCTPAELQARNPMFYALLTNPLYKLPTRLPDGRY